MKLTCQFCQFLARTFRPVTNLSLQKKEVLVPLGSEMCGTVGLVNISAQGTSITPSCNSVVTACAGYFHTSFQYNIVRIKKNHHNHICGSHGRQHRMSMSVFGLLWTLQVTTAVPSGSTGFVSSDPSTYILKTENL